MTIFGFEVFAKDVPLRDEITQDIIDAEKGILERELKVIDQQFTIKAQKAKVAFLMAWLEKDSAS